MKSSVLFFALTIISGSAQAETDPDPHRGLYAIWARDHQIAGWDFVKGGQIFLQWRDLQTGPDRYDFQRLDAALQKQSLLGKPATIQVNGNRKPDFLYERVPTVLQSPESKRTSLSVCRLPTVQRSL